MVQLCSVTGQDRMGGSCRKLEEDFKKIGVPLSMKRVRVLDSGRMRGKNVV